MGRMLFDLPPTTIKRVGLAVTCCGTRTVLPEDHGEGLQRRSSKFCED